MPGTLHTFSMIITLLLVLNNFRYCHCPQRTQTYRFVSKCFYSSMQLFLAEALLYKTMQLALTRAEKLTTLSSPLLHPHLPKRHPSADMDVCEDLEQTLRINKSFQTHVFSFFRLKKALFSLTKNIFDFWYFWRERLALHWNWFDKNGWRWLD